MANHILNLDHFKMSMTRWGTRSATSCCKWSPIVCGHWCATPTRSRLWGVTNSRSCRSGYRMWSMRRVACSTRHRSIERTVRDRWPSSRDRHERGHNLGPIRWLAVGTTDQQRGFGQCRASCRHMNWAPCLWRKGSSGPSPPRPPKRGHGPWPRLRHKGGHERAHAPRRSPQPGCGSVDLIACWRLKA